MKVMFADCAHKNAFSKSAKSVFQGWWADRKPRDIYTCTL